MKPKNTVDSKDKAHLWSILDFTIIFQYVVVFQIGSILWLNKSLELFRCIVKIFNEAYSIFVKKSSAFSNIRWHIDKGYYAISSWDSSL